MDRPSEPIHGPAEHIHRPHHRLRQNAMLLLLLMEMGYAQRSNAGTPKTLLLWLYVRGHASTVTR